MLRYVSNLCLRYVGCYPIGKASFKASRNSGRGGRFISLLEALKLYCSGMKTRRDLWPFLHSATDTLRTAQVLVQRILFLF